MITGIKSKRILLPDRLLDGYLYMEAGKLLSVGATPRPCDELLDFGDLYVAPGFIDLHTHGAAGYSFSDCTPEGILEACRYHMRHGTTTLYPTLSAAPLSQMARAVAVIAGIMEDGSAPISIPGIHMEGPYLSIRQCGAQKPAHITPPIASDYIPFLQEYGKYVARWTYAPENDPEQTFCKHLVKQGILPSVGHSDATYEQLLPAYEAGCTLVTHLYSCTSTITRQQGYRHLGITESAYLLDGLDVELIADGKHLPPELLTMIFKCKDHAHIALVTDSLAAAGLEGAASAGNADYIIEDGVCKLPDRSAFAGSVATGDVLLRNALQAGCSVVDAVSMLTAVPARIMGLPKGRLEPGLDADIVVFDEDINIRAVFAGGVCVEENQPT